MGKSGFMMHLKYSIVINVFNFFSIYKPWSIELLIVIKFSEFTKMLLDRDLQSYDIMIASLIDKILRNNPQTQPDVSFLKSAIK